jgi:DUF4097 and DUF4098 domain-containing protein YvlB
MAEQRFHTPLPLVLEVGIPSGSIEVETVDGEESTVVVEGDERLVEQTEVSIADGRLSVQYRGKSRLLGVSIGFGDFSFGSARLAVRARVPHGAAAQVSTASADVALRGRLRELEAKTASGDVTLRGEVEERAAVRTVSGDVRLGRVGGDLAVQTVSGDVRTDEVAGSAEVKTVSGDIRLESLRTGHATFTSVSGDVEVGIAAGSFLDVDAGSVSGDLSSEVPLATDPGAGGSDGPTVVLRGKTVSGDVTVFRAA